jgi:hypothetical protein
VTLAGREVGERHFEGAADLGVQVMDLGGESVRWKPLGHGIGVEECAIHFFGRRTKDPVQTNGTGGHDIIPLMKGDDFRFGEYTESTNEDRRGGHPPPFSADATAPVDQRPRVA